MKINASPSSANSLASASDAGTLLRLQKRLQQLTKELKGIASENLSPKAKEDKAKLVNAEIQLVQAQIAAIQRKMQEASEHKTEVRRLNTEGTKNSALHQRKIAGVKGFAIDTYA